MNTIQTNKIQYTIDKESLQKKYDIFCIKTEDSFYYASAKVLDILCVAPEVCSVKFSDFNIAYILMNKSSNNPITLAKIIASSQNKSITFSSTGIYEIEDYQLLQLLVNAVYKTGICDEPINNLSGHLYCYCRAWEAKGKKKDTEEIYTKQVKALEFHISKDYCIELNVRTFTNICLKNLISFDKRKFPEYPQYVLSDNGTIRRKTSNDTDTDIFIQRQIDGQKSSTVFLNLESLNAFNRSKTGTLLRILQRFNRIYTGISSIELTTYPISARLDSNPNTYRKKEEEKLKNYLQCHKIHIVNKINTELSNPYINILQEHLKRYYDVTTTSSTKYAHDAINICIIHDKEYYILNQEEDPYENVPSGVTTQHLTLENLSSCLDKELVKPMIRTTLQELVIKQDIKDGKISLYNWKELNIKETSIFGLRFEVDDVEQYYFMKILPNGSFSINLEEWTLFNNSEYMQYIDIFNQESITKKKINGIYRFNAGPIHTISETDYFTIPNIQGIKETLEVQKISRGKESREELLSSVLDIKTYSEQNDLYYFVGTRGSGMTKKIERAATIRKISCLEGEPQFEQILPTMDASFVRNGQLTVVPFPFKYIREYVNAEIRKTQAK